MSEVARSPAIAVWEFSSIADGIFSADAITKSAPVAKLMTGTTQPGKYVVLVAGDTASVEIAVDIVTDGERPLIDTRFLPDVSVQVADALMTGSAGATAIGDAIGVVETSTVSAGIDAADASVKAADVSLAGIHLADGLGGKAYFVLDGDIGDVQAAVDAGVERAGVQILASVVIPQLTIELRDDLAASALFVDRVRSHGESR